METSGSARLTLLEGFELRVEGRPVELPPSGQRLLAFLALQSRPMARMFVAGSLWVDSSEARASGSLRSALWRLGRLRRRLVDGTPHLIGIDPGIRIDLREVGEVARRVIDGTVACESLSFRELSLAGELLPDWYDEWVVIERQRFHQLRLHALETLCRQLVSSGRHAQAVEAGLAAVATEPLRESAHRALIEAYLAEGNQSEAVGQYRTCRRILWQELGLEPSEATARLVASPSV